ncbi:MAG: anti-sigma factor family protein [Chloroflexota bacterium]
MKTLLTRFSRHARLRAQLSAYIDGELPAAERGHVARHLARCSGCTAAFEDYRDVRAAVASLPEVAAPRSFRISREMLAGAPNAAPVKARARPAAPRFAYRAAQATAGLAIAGFVALMVPVLIDGSGDGSRSDERASTSDDAGAPGAAAAAGGQGPERSSVGATALPTAKSGVPPFQGGGGVGGSSDSSPAPAATEAPGQSELRPTGAGTPGVHDNTDSFGPTPGGVLAEVEGRPARAADGEGGIPWRLPAGVGLAVVAGAAIGAAFLLRRRSQ